MLVGPEEEMLTFKNIILCTSATVSQCRGGIAAHIISLTMFQVGESLLIHWIDFEQCRPVA